MYHTHIADINQQGKGLAGGIVVVDDLETHDPARERVYLAQTMLDFAGGNGIPTGLNRRRGELPADTLLAGETYRLRFMNLTLAGSGLWYRFVSDRVLGGAEIYRLCWPRLPRIQLTRVHGAPAGDTALEGLDWAGWQQEACESHPSDERHDYPFSFVSLVRAARD